MTFRSESDARAEREIAARLEVAWRCTLHDLGGLSPVDWYASRGGRVVAWVEAKARTHPISTFPTVFLAVRKYLALQLAAMATDAPPLFVVRWACGAMRWIDVRSVSGGVRVLGHTNPRARMDLEPCFEVPIAAMKEVTNGRDDQAPREGAETERDHDPAESARGDQQDPRSASDA